MVYVDIYSYDFDSIYYRGYKELKKAKEDEGYIEDIVFEGSFSLEEYPEINEWMKVSLATQFIIFWCRQLNIPLQDIIIVNCDFDGKNVSKELKRLIKQNFDVNFGCWKVNKEEE